MNINGSGEIKGLILENSSILLFIRVEGINKPERIKTVSIERKKAKKGFSRIVFSTFKVASFKRLKYFKRITDKIARLLIKIIKRIKNAAFKNNNMYMEITNNKEQTKKNIIFL